MIESSRISSSVVGDIPSTTPALPREVVRPQLKRCKTVAVEGNIGCGKSTFLKTFGNYENIEILMEPVDKWKNVMGSQRFGPNVQRCKKMEWCISEFSYTVNVGSPCSTKAPQPCEDDGAFYIQHKTLLHGQFQGQWFDSSNGL